jgi:serine/threonine-protein kinase
MMARSGGFNVPADYFRSSAMPAPVPAEPVPRPKRWPIYAFIAAVGTVVGTIGIVVVAKSSSSKAQTIATPVAVIAPSQAAATPSAIPAAPLLPAATETAPAVVTREVLVSVVPADANISRGGHDLGQPPLALHLANGENAVLQIARKGYKTKTVTVGPSEPKVAFTLEPVAVPKTGQPAKPAGGDLGIDDVGDPFAKKH